MGQILDDLKYSFIFDGVILIDILIYYMALSHKDWELLNWRIRLAEMDIDRGLNFPI